MICPICASTLDEGRTACPACGAELAEYLTTMAQPDVLYNEALTYICRDNYTVACDLLCRASALRPEDTGILELWIRASYMADNKKRAVELMMDLLELSPTDRLQQCFEKLMAEYELDQATAEQAVKKRLQEQTERLGALLDRMEQSLSTPAEVRAAKTESGEKKKSPPMPGGTLPQGMMAKMFPEGAAVPGQNGEK